MHLAAPNSLLLLLTAPSAVLATSLTIHLPAVPNPFTLPPSTHATLSALHAHHSAPLSSINTFVFHNVTPGSYLADVHCATDAFRPLRIDVLDSDDVQAWDTYRGNDWANKGELRSGGAITVQTLGKKIYFMDRPQFSVLSILKNPMILMGLFSMLIFFGMPKLMENMDPEMKAEFEAQQRQGPLSAVMGGAGAQKQQQNPLGDFDMAAFLAGSKKKDSSGNGNDGRAEPVRR